MRYTTVFIIAITALGAAMRAGVDYDESHAELTTGAPGHSGEGSTSADSPIRDSDDEQMDAELDQKGAEMEQIGAEMEQIMQEVYAMMSLSQYRNVIGVTSGLRGQPQAAAPGWVLYYFDRIKAVAETPEKMFTDVTAKAAVIAIGREINEARGFEGMKKVCEYNKNYSRSIEVTWDRIGDWQA